MKPGTLVEVVWLDAAYRAGEWDPKKQLVETRQCGYVLRDDEELFILAGSYWPGEPTEYGDVTTIPAAWVTSKKRIKA